MQSSLLNERLNSHNAWTEMGKYNLYVYIYIEIDLIEKNCFVRCLLAFVKQLSNCEVSIWTATTATTGEPRLKMFAKSE